VIGLIVGAVLAGLALAVLIVALVLVT